MTVVCTTFAGKQVSNKGQNYNFNPVIFQQRLNSLNDVKDGRIVRKYMKEEAVSWYRTLSRIP